MISIQAEWDSYEYLSAEEVPDALVPWLTCQAVVVPHPEPISRPHPVGWYSPATNIGPTVFMIRFGEANINGGLWWSAFAHELAHHHLHKSSIQAAKTGTRSVEVSLRRQVEADAWVAGHFLGEWWFSDLRPHTARFAEGMKP